MRQRIFVPKAILWLVLILQMAALAGCTKCEQLADYVCGCESTAAGKDSCKKLVKMKSSLSSFDQAVSEERCEEILNDENCNCQAIRNREYEKCGMTRLNPSTGEI